jgi:hypothetical protein
MPRANPGLAIAHTALRVLRCLAAHDPQTVAVLAEQAPTWPVLYHIDVIDFVRWLGEARQLPPPSKDKP